MGTLSALRGQPREGAAVSSQDDLVPPDLAPEAAQGAPAPAGVAADAESTPPNAEFIAAVVAEEARAQDENDVSPEAAVVIDAPAATDSKSASAVVVDEEAHVPPERDLTSLLSAIDKAIQHIDPKSDQATVRSSPLAAEAWGHVRGLTAAAIQFGLAEQVRPVFLKYGRPGEGLWAAVVSQGGLSDAVAQFKTSRPMPAASSERERPRSEPSRSVESSGGGSPSLGGTLAKLVAAPFTIPIAAGSRVWQALTKQFGPRPRVAVHADEFAVLKNQFDEASNRAIEKISHIRSGPMNPVLSEMVSNPLRMDEQFRRMETDVDGEYRERAERLKTQLADPAVKRQYAELQEALDVLQYRGRRLAEAGHEGGQPVDEHITGRIEAVAHQAEGLPTTGKDGQLEQFRDAVRAMVERIREFLQSLFARSAPAP